MSNYIQWTTPDNESYFPAGVTVDRLPPGCYKIEQSMQGLFMKRQDLRENKLIKLPDSNSQKVLEEINKFWTLKEKFDKHEVPYKRGILLYGPPGSGKTSALRTAMEDVMKLDGIVLEYSEPYTFLEGYKIIRQIHENKPIIALMEDLDSKLDYDSTQLLQILDGVHDLNNIVFVATTNYPEKLGSRIFNRPGRFDKRIKIGMPSAESRRAYLQHKGIDEDLEKWVEDTDGMSIAHLAELYTAVNVFEDTYEDALDIIKGMESIPHSSLFDKSSVDSSEESVGKCYYEHKKAKKEGRKISESKKKSKKPITEDKMFGGSVSKPVKSTKKLTSFDDVIDTMSDDNDNSGPSIDQIARLM